MYKLTFEELEAKEKYQSKADKCGFCDGSGKSYYGMPCRACKGSGWFTKERFDQVQRETEARMLGLIK